MRMKGVLLIPFIVFISGCGGVEMPSFGSAVDFQPRVMSVTPEDGREIGPSDEISVVFSIPVDPLSVDKRSVVVKMIGGEKETKDDIVEDAENAKVEGVDGVYVFNEDNTELTFRTKAPYDSGSYLIVATRNVLSVDRFPLSQNPGRAASPFVSGFVVASSGSAPGDGAAGASGGSAGGQGGASSSPSSAAKDRPDVLVINEVLYDAAGSDTEGNVFIELAGDAGGDISDYKILLVNGGDGATSDTIKIPGGSAIASDGIFLIADSKTGGGTNVVGADLVDNFDPQNGPDCIELVDENGALVDALGYGEPIVAKAEDGNSCFEGTPMQKAKSGISLSREDGADTDDNSSDFVALDQPTPGVL